MRPKICISVYKTINLMSLDRVQLIALNLPRYRDCRLVDGVQYDHIPKYTKVIVQHWSTNKKNFDSLN